jgi:hypothetical protein
VKINHVFLSAALVLGALSANAQQGNFGIGVATPTNKLHVKPTTVDPVRFEGVQAASDPDVLTIDANGVVHKVPKSTIGTSTTPTSGAYYNSCGCTKTATVNATIPVPATRNQLQITIATPVVPNADIIAALADPTVCDVAIHFANPVGTKTNIPAGASMNSFNLPPAANYAGRTITWHPELPLQFTLSIDSSFHLYSLYSDVNNTFQMGTLSDWAHVNASIYDWSAGALRISRANQGTTAWPTDVKATPTIRTFSDGISWFVTAFSSPCYVIKL